MSGETGWLETLEEFVGQLESSKEGDQLEEIDQLEFFWKTDKSEEENDPN